MKTLTYISLFSSAGIGCFGFKEQDFECVATNELLEKRLKIQMYNRKCRFDSGYILGDITQTKTQNQLFAEIDKWRTQFHLKEIDVIMATPPCQGMSVANHKKTNELGRNSLVVESIRMVQNIQPKFFIFENVKAFLNTLCTDTDGIDKPITNAIDHNLGGNYNILGKVVNLKDYGAHSSRTRTLVIGVRKDLTHITPFDIFPAKQSAKTLRELFFRLPEIPKMGDIAETDIFHAYREFDSRMLAWIEHLKEGQSAFQNQEAHRIPHQIKNGEMVVNQNKNGDKYARWFWDKEGPCVHTRNDILASQNTIHPSENRVFSVRELMLMMSIPENFQWTNKSFTQLNQLTLPEKKAWLKKEELNIRHCIGEAVPTGVINSIAYKIKSILMNTPLSTQEINQQIKQHHLTDTDNLIKFIECYFDVLGLTKILQLAEYANADRLHHAAFFTRADIAFSVVKNLPDFRQKKILRILEPAVGIGNFIPLLIEKYQDKEKVILDLVDIDPNVLRVLKIILAKLNIAPNFEINFIENDFLLYEFKEQYDIVVGNPPYKKISTVHDQLHQYRQGCLNQDTNNLFAFFIEKAMKLGKFVSLIVPKSLINTPEFNQTRTLLLQNNLMKIADYGEKAFKGVKIETVSFLVETQSKKIQDDILIESYITKTYQNITKSYIFDSKFPYWLIYRNEKFDNIMHKMQFGVFSVFRDRQITKQHTCNSGKYRILKSRNIGNNNIVNIADYDCYIDDIQTFSVAKFLNQPDIVLIPNLSYYPRACFLPENTIADGSVALLQCLGNFRQPEKRDLAYYATEEFEYFYRVARNFGTRSLNIDNNSVFFFGLLKD